MTYNFKLFWRMFHRSFFRAKNTPARLTRKRLVFILLFYLVWPAGSLHLYVSGGVPPCAGFTTAEPSAPP